MAWFMEGNDEWKRQQMLHGRDPDLARRQWMAQNPGAMTVQQPQRGYTLPAVGGAGNAGFGPGQGLLPPNQNPAYQAALQRPRLTGNQLTTISTPSGGTMTVPTGSSERLRTAIKPPVASELPGATPRETQFNISQAYQQGYGTPSTTTIQGAGGPYTSTGGIMNPYSPANPYLSALSTGFGGIYNVLGSAYRGISNMAQNFQNRPSINQQAYNLPQGGPTPGYSNPRRYSDYGYY